MEAENIPIWEMITVTPEQANKITNIGVNQLRDLCKNPECPFVVWNGRNPLINLELFKEYLKKTRRLPR